MSTENTETVESANEENELVNFDWDNEGEISFGPPVIKKTAKEILAEVTDEEDVTPPKTKIVKEKVKEDADTEEFIPFSEGEDEEPKGSKSESTKIKNEVSDEGESGNEPEDEDVKFYTTLTKELKDKGVFSSLDIKDDDEITEDKFFELQQEEIEARVDETITGFFTEMDDDAKAFIQFKKSGGITSDFFGAYAQIPLAKDLNPEDEGDAKKILKFYYTNAESLTGELLDEKLEWLEEKGRLTSTATTVYKKILADEVKAKKDLLDNQLAAQQANKEKVIKMKKELQTSLDGFDSIKDFKITKEDKKSLVSAYMDASVKVGEGRYITPFQQKMGEIMKNPETALLLVKLAMSGFDTKDLETALKTKVTNEVKNKLKDAKKSTPIGGGSNRQGKSLVDYF